MNESRPPLSMPEKDRSSSTNPHRPDAGTGAHASEGERSLEYYIPQRRRRLPQPSTIGKHIPHRRASEQTPPAPTPEIFGRKRSSALPKKTPSSTSPPEKKQTNKRLENRHDNAVEYTNYSPKNYYLSYTTCSGRRFLESPPHPAPERPPEGEIRRNRRLELEFTCQSPRSAL